MLPLKRTLERSTISLFTEYSSEEHARSTATYDPGRGPRLNRGNSGSLTEDR